MGDITVQAGAYFQSRQALMSNSPLRMSKSPACILSRVEVTVNGNLLVNGSVGSPVRFVLKLVPARVYGNRHLARPWILRN